MLIFALLAGSLLASPASPSVAADQDPVPTIRRIASTTLLAVQEYRLGVAGGKIVAAAEVEEASLFLSEAARVALGLPPEEAIAVRSRLEALGGMVRATAAPDSLAREARSLIDDLAGRYHVDVDVIPAVAPSPAAGAQVYQANCAGCHGAVGRGDGADGRTLSPLPANLADAEALADRSPLDFYRRITIGVAGTGMVPFESRLTDDERWAVAVYATLLRLPPAAATPEASAALLAFPTSARLTDREVLAALGPTATLAQVAAVRTAAPPAPSRSADLVFQTVRRLADSARTLARSDQREPARATALDAYLQFEAVERDVRLKNAGLASEAEAAFARLRHSAESQTVDQVDAAHRDLLAVLERAERAIADRPSRTNLAVQSFIILAREGLEAILVIGALMAFLARTGATNRRRDIHVGVAAAVAMSLLTALALETIFLISPAEQEALEGVTLLVATAMLFYVSYWLLSKLEVAKWNAFVRSRVKDAVSSGSALALASVAFLAVYREGFETVLFYKALVVSGGAAAWAPVLVGIAGASVVLAVLYVAINRFGVRLPLKPFFGVTSAFLYYMAFVFAGKGIAELQGADWISTTVIPGPRIAALGVYPTVESLAAQGVLALLALIAVGWIFAVAPHRERRAAAPAAAAPQEPRPDTRHELDRSLDRIEADLAEIRAELARIREREKVSG